MGSGDGSDGVGSGGGPGNGSGTGGLGVPDMTGEVANIAVSSIGRSFLSGRNASD